MSGSKYILERVMKYAVSRMGNINNPEFDELHTLVRTLTLECGRLRAVVADIYIHDDRNMGNLVSVLGRNARERFLHGKAILSEHDAAMTKLLGGEE
jgi:hypothetical protein